MCDGDWDGEQSDSGEVWYVSDAVTKALEAFKETITESRVTGSRERDEFKADIVDLRLSLGSGLCMWRLDKGCAGVVEKRCERKIEEKMGGLERRVGVVEASRKRIEEGLREERVGMWLG